MSERKAVYTIAIVDKYNRQIGSEELPAMTRKDAYKKLLKHLHELSNDSLVTGGYLKFERYE